MGSGKDYTMADNIFKQLRLERTEETVMRGEGKSIEVKRPYTGTRLAKELNISQTTLDNVENGKSPSLAVVEAYHKYFKIPYSTLLGETSIEDINNFNINMELGLTDASIATIKGMNPISLAMLNAFLSKEEDTIYFLGNLAENVYSMTEYLIQNGNDKSDPKYIKMRDITKELFMDYMRNITFKDLKDVLLKMEHQQQIIDTLQAEQAYQE